MFCEWCGKRIDDDSAFCGYCGAKVTVFGNETGETEEQFESQTDSSPLNEEQITALYQENYNPVYRSVLYIVKNEHDAEDIVQDTFVKAFEHFGQLEDKTKFSAWIKQIGINNAKNYLKKKKPSLFTDLSPEAGEMDEPVEERFRDERQENLPEVVLDRDETARLIMEILNALPDEQRIAVSMFYYEEYSVRQIAEELGLTESAVKSRLAYGRKKIEKEVLALEKRGTKLYGLMPVSFFLLLLRNMDARACEYDAGLLEEILKTKRGTTKPIGHSVKEVAKTSSWNGGGSTIPTAGGDVGATVTAGGTAGTGAVATTGGIGAVTVSGGVGTAGAVAGKAIGLKIALTGLAILAGLGGAVGGYQIVKAYRNYRVENEVAESVSETLAGESVDVTSQEMTLTNSEEQESFVEEAVDSTTQQGFNLEERIDDEIDKEKGETEETVKIETVTADGQDDLSERDALIPPEFEPFHSVIDELLARDDLRGGWSLALIDTNHDGKEELVVWMHSGDTFVKEVLSLDESGEINRRTGETLNIESVNWEYDLDTPEIGIYDGTIISKEMGVFFGEFEFIMEDAKLNNRDDMTPAIWPIDAIASSTLAASGGNGYDARMAIDKGMSFDQTAWVEGVNGDGIGETLDLSVEPGSVLRSIYIAPGYTKSNDLFYKNSMPTKILLSTDKQEVELDLTAYDPFSGSDPITGRRIVFDEPLVSDGSVRLTILNVRTGSKYQDTAISNVFFD